MKFALHSAYKNDHEGSTIAWYCSMNRIPYRIYERARDVPPDCVPVGSVKWVEQVLGRIETPDYYPDFLAPWLHRKIWRADKWPLGHRVFIKPSDRHKRFTGFVTNGTWKGKKKGPYWCSEVVRFVSEWRWYISRGQIIDARWGSGEQELPVPDLDIEWPSDYSAAVDFGLLDNGKIALIESNSPFACGWYGPINQGTTYIRWLTEGWEDLKRQPVQFPTKSTSTVDSSLGAVEVAPESP